MSRFLGSLSAASRFLGDTPDASPRAWAARAALPISTSRFSPNEDAAWSDFLETLRSAGLIHNSKIALTLEGSSAFAKMRDQIRTGNQAFVAMHFHPDLLLAYERGIHKPLNDTGYRPYMLLDEHHLDSIDNMIRSQIRSSSLVVADLTGQRPSVYFEAGFAQGLGIPVLLTCHEDDQKNIHFDLRQFPTILWSTTDHLAQELTNTIRGLGLDRDRSAFENRMP